MLSKSITLNAMSIFIVKSINLLLRLFVFCIFLYICIYHIAISHFLRRGMHFVFKASHLSSSPLAFGNLILVPKCNNFFLNFFMCMRTCICIWYSVFLYLYFVDPSALASCQPNLVSEIKALCKSAKNNLESHQTSYVTYQKSVHITRNSHH